MKLYCKSNPDLFSIERISYQLVSSMCKTFGKVVQEFEKLLGGFTVLTSFRFNRDIIGPMHQIMGLCPFASLIRLLLWINLINFISSYPTQLSFTLIKKIKKKKKLSFLLIFIYINKNIKKRLHQICRRLIL